MQRSSCSRLRSSTWPNVLTDAMSPSFPFRWSAHSGQVPAGRMRARPAGPAFRSGRGRLQLLLPAVVRLELRHERLAERTQSGDERVELVQRVLAPLDRVEVEGERDPSIAVGDLDDQLRLEVAARVAVVRAVRAAKRPFRR